MESDAQLDISQAQPYWIHCAAGMHIGKMDPRPMVGEFGAVLSLAEEAGKVDERVSHRHIPMSYLALDPQALADAIDFVHEQFATDRTVLVRSEGGLQRPALVVAAVCVRLGASYSEALYCVRRNAPKALTDFRYLNVLRVLWESWK